jgi:hypothetical protein
MTFYSDITNSNSKFLLIYLDYNGELIVESYETEEKLNYDLEHNEKDFTQWTNDYKIIKIRNGN